MKALPVLMMLLLAAGVGVLLFVQNRSPQPGTGTVEQSSPSPSGQSGSDQDGSLSGEVVETMDSGGYTYVQIDTGGEKIWAAGPVTPLEKGAKISIPSGMVMTDFRSESLNRSFDKIYFVSSFSGKTGGHGGGLPQGHPPIGDGDDVAATMDFTGIDVPVNGHDIATVYGQRQELEGKSVIVRGKVVKATNRVMGKNWLHLRDGTGGEGTNDLTVTTDETAKVGDVVTATGRLSLNRDFGAGYTYEVIMEDAAVAVETDS